MSDKTFNEEVLRDPRVVYARSLNNRGLLAEPTVGDSMGQAVIFNDVAADVGRLGDDSLEFYSVENGVSRMEFLSHSYERKKMDKHRNAVLWSSGYVALVSAFPGRTWVEWSCVGLATIFAGFVLKKHNGLSKEAFEQACSIQIRQGNQQILANEIVRRDPDVKALQLSVNGQRHTLVLD